MTMVRTYTSAEPYYDGFGTRTLPFKGQTDWGQEVRLVETPAPHVEWQRARYASGLHLAFSQTEWDAMVTKGQAQENPS